MRNVVESFGDGRSSLLSDVLEALAEEEARLGIAEGSNDVEVVFELAESITTLRQYRVELEHQLRELLRGEYEYLEELKAEQRVPGRRARNGSSNGGPRLQIVNSEGRRRVERDHGVASYNSLVLEYREEYQALQALGSEAKWAAQLPLEGLRPPQFVDAVEVQERAKATWAAYLEKKQTLAAAERMLEDKILTQMQVDREIRDFEGQVRAARDALDEVATD